MFTLHYCLFNSKSIAVKLFVGLYFLFIAKSSLQQKLKGRNEAKENGINKKREMLRKKRKKKSEW